MRVYIIHNAEGYQEVLTLHDSHLRQEVRVAGPCSAILPADRL